MFDLKICGYQELQTVIPLWQPTHVLSVLDNIDALPGKHLFIKVSDIPEPIEGRIHPAREHLEQVFAFTADLTDSDRLLVHCYAGMSRSTAIAIGVLMQHGMAYDEAFNHVKIIRPTLIPNQMFIELIDEHFGLKGDLIAMVAANLMILPPPLETASDISVAEMKKILYRLP